MIVSLLMIILTKRSGITSTPRRMGSLGMEPQVMALSFKSKNRIIKIGNHHMINETRSQVQYAIMNSLLFEKAINRVKK